MLAAKIQQLLRFFQAANQRAGHVAALENHRNGRERRVDVTDQTDKHQRTIEFQRRHIGIHIVLIRHGVDNQVKLILLDINLGKDSGFELCRALRKDTDVPILFISARQSDDDVLIALNIGGDDYIKKPYSLSVLLAKVKVIIKRYDGAVLKAGSSDAVSAQLEAPDRCGNLRIDKDAMKVYRYDKDVGFKTKEFKLFFCSY